MILDCFFTETRNAYLGHVNIRFFTSNQRKIRLEVHLDELWSVDCRPWTIICRSKNSLPHC